MATYAKIKEIKDKENKNLIKVLKYIAEKEGYLKGENIEYRKLYYGFLRDEFLDTANSINANLNVNGFKVSYKQFKRLRIYRRGRFPIHTAVYLLSLYEIMYRYKKKLNLGKVKDNISYTTYIANELKEEIETILILNNVDPILKKTFRDVSNDFVNLDNITGRRSRKIYNNIW